MTMKISVIMPVYNAQDFLENSLSLLVNQSFQNIEIICIDDGSTDNSLNIIEKFAQKDNRIRVFKQKNAGPSAARQKGLDNAAGEYVWFVDSDDTYEHTSIEQITNALKNTPVDILYFGTKLTDKTTDKNPSERYYALADVPKARLNRILKFDENAYLMFSLPRELWNKVFRREFLSQHDIRFCPSISLYDDILFSTQALLYSESISIINASLYNYHLNNSGSVMGTYNQRLDGIFYYFKTIYSLLFDEKSKYSGFVKRAWLCREVCSLNFWLTRKNIEKTNYYKSLKTLYKSIEKDIDGLVAGNTYQAKNIQKAKEIIHKW